MSKKKPSEIPDQYPEKNMIFPWEKLFTKELSQLI